MNYTTRILITLTALAFAGCASFTGNTATTVNDAASIALVFAKNPDKLAAQFVQAGNALKALSGTATREEVLAAINAALPNADVRTKAVITLVVNRYNPSPVFNNAAVFGDLLVKAGEGYLPLPVK